MSDHPAHILFKNDVPATQPPSAGSGPAAAAVPATGTGGNPASPAGPADAAKRDDAAALFKDGAADLGAKAVTEILDGFANSAISDQDGGERSRAIEYAREGLLSDALDHGTDTADLAEVMSVVKELQANSIVERTPEAAAEAMAAGLAQCRAENISDADLGIARRFISDIEKVAPGTIATLERTGAGSDIRLIRKAVAEARRRSYR